MKPCIAYVVLAAWFSFGVAAFSLGQTYSPSTVPTVSTQPLPKDPKSLLALLGDTNGLDTSGNLAWHIKLAYDHFDSDGDNDSSGTYEEFWAGPKKYKRVYTSEAFTQTEIATERGLFFIGNQKWPGMIETQVREEVVEPLYREKLSRLPTKLDKLDWSIGPVKLPCVVLRNPDLVISDNGLPKYCYGPDASTLRYTRGGGWDETIYNKIVLFHDRYIAREVAVTQGAKKYLQIHVQIIESIAEVRDEDFSPSPGAFGPVGDGIEIPGALLAQDLLEAPFFQYPRGTHGEAHLELVVGTDGRVINVRAIDGSPDVIKAAIASAYKMHFRPFLILGAPVEVKTSLELQVQ
jgi:hypothetical protein